MQLAAPQEKEEVWLQLCGRPQRRRPRPRRQHRLRQRPALSPTTTIAATAAPVPIRGTVRVYAWDTYIVL